MEPQSCFHHIRELIARDQMQEAMAALRTLVENTPRLNDLDLQSGRLENVLRQLRLGVIDDDTAAREQNSIRYGVLELLSEIEKQQIPDKAALDDLPTAVETESGRPEVQKEVDHGIRFLRPDFTKKIATGLENGKSINIHGPKGCGKKWLVNDLSKCLPNNTYFVRIDIRTCAKSFKDFLESLKDGLKIEGQNHQDTDSIQNLINRFLEKSPNRLWICLERFDYMSLAKIDSEGVDEMYNSSFLSYLNSLKNNPKISLLVCSENPISAQYLHIGGKVVSGSHLEFSTTTQLPQLSVGEITKQLICCHHQLVVGKENNYLDALVNEIFRHSQPADFLAYICSQRLEPNWKIEDFRKALMVWKKDFKRRQRPGIDKLIDELNNFTRKWGWRITRFLGIGKIWYHLFQNVKTAILIIVPIAFALLRYGEKIWNFILSFLGKFSQ